MTFKEVFGLGVILVWVFAFVGWCMNLYSVVSWIVSNPDTSTITVLVIGRIIGIFFAPLGAVLGYF